MKLKTLSLALVATAFMASAALAQSGTMQPIANPPEKAKAMHHGKMMHHGKAMHHKKMAKASAPADAASSSTPAAMAKTPMPAKK